MTDNSLAIIGCGGIFQHIYRPTLQLLEVMMEQAKDTSHELTEKAIEV